MKIDSRRKLSELMEPMALRTVTSNVGKGSYTKFERSMKRAQRGGSATDPPPQHRNASASHIKDSQFPLRTSSGLTTIVRKPVPSTNANERLAAFFCAKETRSSYTDADIAEISSLLRLSDASWCQVPQTYIVLRTLGCLDLLNDFIDMGFTDHWFPVALRSLPQLQTYPRVFAPNSSEPKTWSSQSPSILRKAKAAAIDISRKASNFPSKSKKSSAPEALVK